MWTKSSFSESGANCVEAQRSCANTDCVTLRDSNDPGKTITVSDEDFGIFLRGVKNGDFDHLITAGASA
jgi:hypothetical protein